jgi:hypothetical protein
MSHKQKKSFLVLAPLDPYFLSIFSELVSKLSKAYPNHYILIVPVWGIKFGRSCQGSSLQKFFKWLLLSFRYLKSQLLLNHQLKRMFSQQGLRPFPKNTVLINHIAYRFASLTRRILNYERTCFATQLEKYKVGPITAGDLIIDTFLRYRPSPSFCVSDPFIGDIIQLAHSYYDFFEYLFSKYHVKAAFGSFTAYVHHGIPLRLCQYHNIESYTFGASSTFYRHHTPSSFLSHVADHTKYSLHNPLEDSYSLKQADNSLANRIYGKRDTTISYMRKFSPDHSVNASVAGKHIIFLHDFFDSPHIYRWMLHHDFCHWITDTLDILNSRGLVVFIKPHPNQGNESSVVVEKLKSKYSAQPNVHWLPEQASNISLLRQSPRLVITVYGSIIAESAYCNIRSISAGDHPAINCNLSYDPVDLSDYHHKLLNPELIPPPRKENAITFLAQHTPEYSGSNIPSLIQYLDTSFSELTDNAEILYSLRTKRFLTQSLGKLLASPTFYPNG